MVLHFRFAISVRNLVRMKGDVVIVYAVLDGRREPTATHNRCVDADSTMDDFDNKGSA